MAANSVIDPATSLKPWWGPVVLEEGHYWHLAIGPLSIYLARQAQEWRIAWENQPDTQENNRLSSERLWYLPEHLTAHRYVFGSAPDRLQLKPLLPDRPTVVKTNEPVMIPPGEQGTFYISSPVSVSIESERLEKPLVELPTVLLSDTWFGPNTREGELCYAARTSARNEKADVPLRPYRAVTPVTLHNHAKETLKIEKLSIPLPFLAVYGQDDGTLWTEPVTLEHHSAESLATMKIGKIPHGARQLAPARLPAQKHNVVRAFINLFTD